VKALVVILGLAACGFTVSATGTGDDARIDGAPGGDSGGSGGGGGNGGDGTPRDVPHVPASHESDLGTADATLGNNVVIDTTNLTITPAVAGLRIDPLTPEPTGPQVMLVRAHGITIPAGATVIVRGSRPLVLLADVIRIGGLLDAGGKLAVPGPGGATLVAPAPAGNGGAGVHRGSYADSGGGGGGHGDLAGVGGIGSSGCGTAAPSGAAGAAWGSVTLDVLRGGAAGGQGSAAVCTPAVVGAGGGAVQLSALTMLVIESTGAVNVGGGGGGAGVNCGGSDTGAGSGGGAGGALYLDAPTVQRDGALAANGGAGGGGGSSPGTTGSPGGNATAAMTAAQGGNGGGSYGTRGGNGGIANMVATKGVDEDCDGNGGGGGGAVGRIVLHAGAVTGSGIVTPPAMMLAF